MTGKIQRDSTSGKLYRGTDATTACCCGSSPCSCTCCGPQPGVADSTGISVCQWRVTIVGITPCHTASGISGTWTVAGRDGTDASDTDCGVIYELPGSQMTNAYGDTLAVQISFLPGYCSSRACLTVGAGRLIAKAPNNYTRKVFTNDGILFSTGRLSGTSGFGSQGGTAPQGICSVGSDVSPDADQFASCYTSRSWANAITYCGNGSNDQNDPAGYGGSVTVTPVAPGQS